MSIKVNDEVMIITESGSADPTKIGKVVNIYELSTDNIAIVEFHEEKEIKKVSVSNLIKVKNCENREANPDIPEGAKRIIKEEMLAALMKVTNFENMSESMLGKIDPIRQLLASVAARLTGGRIIEELYDGKDEIVITEDQFSKALRDGLALEKLSRDVDGKMDPIKLAPIGIMNTLILERMIPVLFGGESENE